MMCKYYTNTYLNPVFAKTGWGTTQYSGTASDVLLEVFLPMMSLAECKKTYSSSPSHVVTDSHLCAGYKEGGKDSCQVLMQ